MAARQREPQSIAFLGWMVAVAATAAAWWFSFFPFLVCALVVVATVMLEPAPQLSSRAKNYEPTPAEVARQDSYRWVKALGATANPLAWVSEVVGGLIKLRPSAIAAVGASLMALQVSTSPAALQQVWPTVDFPPSLFWVNSVAVLALYSGLSSAYRTKREDYPGVSITGDTTWWKHLGAVIVGLIGALLVMSAIPALGQALPNMFAPNVRMMIPVIGGFLFFFGVADFLLISTTALARWRRVIQTRRMWEDNFRLALGLKPDQTPVVTDVEDVGPYLVTHFRARPSLAVPDIMKKYRIPIQNLADGGRHNVVVEQPEKNGEGEDIPGSKSRLDFYVLNFDPAEVPSLTDASIDPAHGVHLLTTIFANASDIYADNRIVVTGMTNIATEDSPPAWYVTAYGEGQITVEALSKEYSRVIDIPGMALWGDGYMLPDAVVLTPPDYTQVTFADGNPFSAQAKRVPSITSTDDDQAAKDLLWTLDQYNTWVDRWNTMTRTAMSKLPIPAWDTYTTAKIPSSSTEITSLSFQVASGVSVETMLDAKAERELASAFTPGAAFCSIVGYPDIKPGSRKSNAFTVRYTQGGNVPDRPEAIPVPREERVGARNVQRNAAWNWLVTHFINQAFDAARLDRPEVMSVLPLTVGGSRRGTSLWQAEVMLQGGVTAAGIRQFSLDKIRAGARSEWLQVIEHQDHPAKLTIYIGANYKNTKLRPDVDLHPLRNAEWSHMWGTVMKRSGRTPTLLESRFLESNPKVEELIFAYPEGWSYEMVSEKTSKISSFTGNQFISIERGQTPDRFRVLACADDPLPFPAPMDYDLINAHAEHAEVFFSSGIDGSPISWNPADDPHLMIVGGSGSGKSAFMQTVMHAVLVKGWQTVVIDPAKGAADFQFFDPWLYGQAIDTFEASAMMNAVYAEVQRRKTLNSQYSARVLDDLPDEVRPPRLVVFIDEFTSLVTAERLRKPTTEDPDILREYNQRLALNEAISNIGTKIAKITMEARSANVNIVLAGQRVTSSTLADIPGGDTLRTNMARVILGKTTLGERQSALKSPFDAPDLGDFIPKGRGLFESTSSSAVIFQAWYDHEMKDKLPAQLVRVQEPTGERIDLDAFLAASKPVIEGEEIVVEEVEEIEDGVVEIELDDFEIDIDFEDEDEETPVIVDSAPEVEEVHNDTPENDTIERGDEVAIFVGVDGVTTPKDDTDLAHIWPDARRVQTLFGPVQTSALMMTHLTQMGHLVWLSGWGSEANDVFGTDFDVVDMTDPEALGRYLDDRPHIGAALMLGSEDDSWIELMRTTCAARDVGFEHVDVGLLTPEVVGAEVDTPEVVEAEVDDPEPPPPTYVDPRAYEDPWA